MFFPLGWYQKKTHKVLRNAILTKYPSYIKEYDKVMGGFSTHFHNMFITNKTIFNKYMEFVFNILEEVQKHIYEVPAVKIRLREFGYLSEYLLKTFIDHNKYKFKTLPFNFKK